MELRLRLSRRLRLRLRPAFQLFILLPAAAAARDASLHKEKLLQEGAGERERESSRSPTGFWSISSPLTPFAQAAAAVWLHILPKMV